MVNFGKTLIATMVWCAILCGQLLGQGYPKNYLPPVKHPIRLSGTFGELRTSHFHMGIDIKSSNGGEGDPVLAVQDGFVSRIRVQAGGYGNVLYVDHPDGWTSVYAHLASFRGDIADYVQKIQYESEQFEIDIAPGDTLFIVKKGDQIARMGNTGWSFGPHLHFELRRTSSEVAYNPLHLGYQLVDERPPVIKRLLAYHLDARVRNRDVKAWDLQHNSSTYRPRTDTITLPGDLSGFGVTTYDQMDMTHNRNGIYRVDAWLDESLVYQFAFDSLDFENSRRIETHLDHRWMAFSGERTHRCYRTPADELSIYPSNELSGLVKLYKDHPARLRMTVSDYRGNTSEIVCWVKKGASQTQARDYHYVIPWDNSVDLLLHGIRLKFPERCVPEDMFLFLEKGQRNRYGLVDTFVIGSYDEKPIRDYEAFIPLPKADSLLIAPWALLWISPNGSVRNMGGEIRNDSLVVRLDRFGTFVVSQDTVAPRIRPLRLKPSMYRNQTIEFEISDNWEVAGTARELRYRGTMNGKWVLFNYDLKKRKITFRWPDHLKAGTYDLQLSVRDDRDNETNFTYSVRLLN